MTRKEREIARDAERLREMREGTILTAPAHVRAMQESRIRETRGGSRIGRRAAKAHSGSFGRAPEDANVRCHVSRGSRVRIVSATPTQFDRIAENGIALPS